MSIKGSDRARVVVGMKGLEDFISRTPTTDRLTTVWNKEPAVQIQGRRCTPPPTARALLGTPTGGHYPDPGYQHKGHHRLSPYTKSSVRIDPGTEVRNKEQPGGRPASQPPRRMERPASRAPNQASLSDPRRVPHYPGMRIQERREGR